MPFRRHHRSKESTSPHWLSSRTGSQTLEWSTPNNLSSASLALTPLLSRSSLDLLQYNEFHDSNTLDAQLGPRLRALQDSLRNPDLSLPVRKILQTAYNQFERESARNQEFLPMYTPDYPPPYLR